VRARDHESGRCQHQDFTHFVSPLCRSMLIFFSLVSAMHAELAFDAGMELATLGTP
jgi:hypothetical protein